MSLTAGTPLQNGKYIIQTVLEQSDFGTTYQAAHVFLDQTVILQTLENKHSDPEKAARFEQQFLAGVRRLSKGGYSYAGRVLDYFSEEHRPYVVLEYIPGQPLPKMLDWLLSAQAAQGELNGVQDRAREPAEDVNSGATVSDVGVPTIAQVTTALQQPNGATSNGSTTSGSASNSSVTNGALSHKTGLPTPPHPDPATVVVARSSPERSPAQSPAQVIVGAKRKTSPWLPASLLMTTVIAGLAGAGLGVTLRFNPSAQNHPIFSHEQDFPPLEGWPIQETTIDQSSTFDRERPTYRLDESPLDDRYITPEVAPIDPVDPEKVTLPDADSIPKTPTEFEGGDPLAPEALPLPDPAADSSLPPTEPESVPPSNLGQEPTPLPDVEIPPGVIDPATQP
ncbi:MAG: hypothetical protein SFY66_13250 [Oculatellaceae cyanobacterium bins.114]|nr:hypothetical protein [Oculatellaceae cyanobacterium bins.114]